MKRILFTALVFTVAISGYAQFRQESEIPAYNAAPPAKGQTLPVILSDFSSPMFTRPFQIASYKAAAKVPNVIHQLPCYCRCDMSAGHNSLHSCFESAHGAHCDMCMREAVFAYQQTKAGKTPEQIRAAIIKGDMKSLDLAKVTPADITDIRPAAKRPAHATAKKSAGQ